GALRATVRTARARAQAPAAATTAGALAVSDAQLPRVRAPDAAADARSSGTGAGRAFRVVGALHGVVRAPDARAGTPAAAAAAPGTLGVVGTHRAIVGTASACADAPAARTLRVHKARCTVVRAAAAKPAVRVRQA